MKNLKRERKLKGRKICHGTTENCASLVKLGKHRPFGKLTPKGTKPLKKEKKSYK